MRTIRHRPFLLLSLLLGACASGDPKPGGDATGDEDVDLGPAVTDFTSQAGGCYSLRIVEDGEDIGFVALDGDELSTDPDVGVALTFRPSDLGTYLLYDPDGRWISAESGPLTREAKLQSDVSRADDTYISGGEWVLEAGGVSPSRYQLRSRKLGQLFAVGGLVADDALGAQITLVPAEGCATPPEASLDATGTITRTTWDDGDLYGMADAHSHLLTNYSFGGGIFHGGPFHRLGVEHALHDCDVVHGEDGRRDFFGFAYDGAGNDTSGLTDAIGEILIGELNDPNHMTPGWPEFPDWPNARLRTTHQTQYHRWIERAWMGGLRLVVQHATSNAVICNLVVGQGIAPSRYDCEDMTAVDRILDESRQMERYIDALNGGEGEGWFRIVETPAEARAVIEEGKLAVILGIETSDLFDCHLTQRPGGPTCDAAWVDAELDAYYARGVRALFPVHKYDNQFTPGDGSSGFLELGNFLNSGHYTNQTTDCPTEDLPSGFDGGDVTFGGLLRPRDPFLSPAPLDFGGFAEDPLGTLLPYVGEITGGPAEGDYCQNGSVTDLGEHLLEGMMQRGMIVELDHFPQWSYLRAHEILEANDYPGAGTHGREWGGRLYALGGISTVGVGTCRSGDRAGAMLDDVAAEMDKIVAVGGYPGTPLGFDFNGFAHGPGPRFGEDGCSAPQDDPVTWPFLSLAGDVELTEPQLGNRTVDFATEGMIHLGLLPELIDEARRDAGDDGALEPLFRGAEAYVRMWERAESRAAVLRADD